MLRRVCGFATTPFLALTILLACSGDEASPVAPEGTVLHLEASPLTITANGTTTITVVAVHSSGVPAREGTEILLSTSLGTLADDLLRTDRDGIARTTLRADGRSGKATVTARSGRAAQKTVEVTIGSGTPTAVVANFDASVGESLTVVFSDTSTGNPTSWEWQLGDGSRSSERELIHTYAQAGSYLVTLTVRHPDGQDSISKRITVPASQTAAPVADFDVVVAGLQATFTDTSTGTVASWDWSFGDGARSSLQHPVHVYFRPGVYSVTLTVTNAGGSDSESRSLPVPTTAAPVASFDFRETDAFRVLFRDTSENEPTSWEWNFGDGTPRVTDRNPTHTFAAAGVYTVTLTVANLAGRSTATAFVSVRGPLVASFTAQEMGRTISFRDTSTGQPTRFEWNFGDGTPQVTDRNPTHTFAMAGTYVVTLVVSRTVSGGTAEEQASTNQTFSVSNP